MSKDKIKQTAARYADALVQSSDLACEMYDKDTDNFSENESYIVVELTSLYYLYKINKYEKNIIR